MWAMSPNSVRLVAHVAGPGPGKRQEGRCLKQHVELAHIQSTNLNPHLNRLQKNAKSKNFEKQLQVNH